LLLFLFFKSKYFRAQDHPEVLAVMGNMVLTLEAMGRHSDARSLKSYILGPDQAEEQGEEGYEGYDNEDGYDEAEWEEDDMYDEGADWTRNGVNAFNRNDQEQWRGGEDRWRGNNADGGRKVVGSSWEESSWPNRGAHPSPTGVSNGNRAARGQDERWDERGRSAAQRERWPSLDRTPGAQERGGKGRGGGGGGGRGGGGRGGSSHAIDTHWIGDGWGGKGKGNGGSKVTSHATKQTTSSGKGGGANLAGYTVGQIRNNGKKHSAVVGGYSGSWSSYEEVDAPSSSRANGLHVVASSARAGRTRVDQYEDWS